ncbi:MAG: hypothetical protein GY810_01470 [Aureispira sp.]|nr:hypothetical protein [Aureispira sp.]
MVPIVMRYFVAHLVEHLNWVQMVAGSIPVDISTRNTDFVHPVFKQVI